MRGRLRFLAGFAPAASLIVLLAGHFVGPLAMLVAVIMSLLVLVWRFDNESGTFLPLAILSLLVMGVMVALLALLALHR